MSTVLVVDDSPADRRLAAMVLERDIAAKVACAATGREAMDLLSGPVPDIVVTDFRMPDMNGLELIRAIRASHPCLPVILITGHGSEQLAAEALRCGAASYLPKANLERDLATTVARVLVAAAPSRSLRDLVTRTRHLDMRYVLDNDPAVIQPLVSHLQGYLVPMGICDEPECLKVGIALVEALHNAIFHGNLELGSDMREEEHGRYLQLADARRQQSPYRDRRVEVTVHLDGGEAVYVVRDDGAGFDPKAVPDPRQPEHLTRSSGRGLLLIRTFMDEVRHNARGNEITMIKRARSG